MKKLILIGACLLLLCGCDSSKNKFDTVTYTTLYPIEYATKFMYSDFSDIKNVYPSGADYKTYELTDKQKDVYSKGNIFIYAGVTKEVNLAVDFLNSNENLTIIDASRGINYNYGIEELWLDPSNYLMIARNIKSTLTDYETNVYSQEKINENYDDLKVKISELDVELTMMGKNKSKENILVSDDSFLFLSKYNVNVISLDPENENSTKSYNDARKLIQSGDIKYIFTLKGNEISDEVKKFINENKLEELEIDSMYTLTDEQRKNNDDYITIMNENITKLKTELFR